MEGLAIKDVAERTGVAAATIRIWEQRYGFPTPRRTPAGYRVYSEQDVQRLRRVVNLRGGGLSVPAAMERALAAQDGPTDSPSIYAAVTGSDAPVRPQVLRKSTLTAISRAIEDETLARAASPVIVGAFQRERNYRAVEHRYQRMAQTADAAIVFADFGALRSSDGSPTEVPVSVEQAIGNEWAVVVDAPGYAACLLGWEPPSWRRDPELHDDDRSFEALWTLDPRVVRRAVHMASALAGRVDPQLGRRLEERLEGRPLATETPAPGLTALTNRIITYLESPPTEP